MDNKWIPDFTGKRIWMYWPDEKACQFKENVEKGFMACGLPNDMEVGDLNEIMNTRATEPPHLRPKRVTPVGSQKSVELER